VVRIRIETRVERQKIRRKADFSLFDFFLCFLFF
jgi:hypothetical protein